MSKLKVGDQVRAVHFAVDREGTTDPDTGLISVPGEHSWLGGAVYGAVCKRCGTVRTSPDQVPTACHDEVISIDDNVTVPAGTLGVVDFVDDAGQAHVVWENGRRLALVPGQDKWAVVQKVNET